MQLGPYEIVAPLGAGGMGEVYRARDAKLARDVAIKVLSPAFAEDAARMQRFEREAQVLASLNHPNIAAIYGIEAGAIVMELVDGEDLRGPVSVDTAIAYARQIAAGLEAAHEKGIVHRDLKPANIKVTPDGTVKLLDFGLAKATESSAPASTAASPTLSPTLSLAMTQAGMILGTAAYMAPEQARGKIVDRRADIWAFGCVLYELLTGAMLFGGGETVSDSLAAVLTREPNYNKLPRDTPAHIRRLLERCLRKDPKLRLRDIGEARIALDETAAPAEASPSAVPARRALVPWTIAAVLTLALAATLWYALRPAPTMPLLRLNVDLGPESVVGGRTTAALAPDGSRIVFPLQHEGGVPQLATRLLADDKVIPLAGTEGGGDPFFSPDGRWIGFFAGSQLKKVSVQGGAAITVCEADNPRGAAWLRDGTIVFTPGPTAPLLRVPENGGTPQPLTNMAARGQRTNRWPQLVPGTGALLFTAHTTIGGFDEAELDVLDLKSGQTKTIHRGGYFGRCVPSGHILFINRGTLYAVKFDVSRLETLGAPVALASDVAVNAISASGQFAVSAEGSGTLVYIAGRPQDQAYPIQWMNAAGETQMLLAAPRLYHSPSLSPDGRFLAMSTGGLVFGDLHVLDISRGSLSQLTFNGQSNTQPTWAPDGKHLAFVSKPDSRYILWWIRADGSGQPRKLLESADTLLFASFSPDGRHIAFSRTSMGTGGDIWILPLDLTDLDNPRPGTPELFLQTPKSESGPVFSPDGKWLAYQSDESGRYEVYVRPFPGPGGKWLVSSDGGTSPAWSAASHQIFYSTPNGHQMRVVDYQAHGDAFAASPPRPWGGSRRLISSSGTDFAVSPDGKRIVGFISEIKEADHAGNLQMTFLVNFFDELKRKVPLKP